ncbi:MAG: hypothetical protein QOD75_3492 [Blastocatellia bacterium]|nr:hypothetical protein [Blastocatellia bacterium]
MTLIGRRPLRGLLDILRDRSWGSAALHPRPYAATRFAGEVCLLTSVRDLTRGAPVDGQRYGYPLRSRIG